jgi:putative glutamine amidotransferase
MRQKVLVTLGRDRTPTYAAALRMVEIEPVCVDPTMKPQAWRAAFADCAGLLLSGGGDVDSVRYDKTLAAEVKKEFICGVDEVRDEMELELAQKAVAMDMPVFAICRGIQVLNVALGGTLIYDVPTRVGKTINHANRIADLAHDATWEQSSRVVKELGHDYPQVNTSHHQALDRVAKDLRVIARAPDGVVEAVENADAKFLVGVQFHPERLVKDHAEFLELFRIFQRAV